MYILSIVSLSLITMPAVAQFGGLGKKIMKKTGDKIERKIEYEVSERIANEIADRAMRPVNAVLDSIFNENQTNWEEMGKSMEEFAKNMDRIEDLPDAYNFDYVVDTEFKDYDKKKHKMQMYLSSTKSIFAMRNPDQGDQSDDIIVMDMEAGITAMYRVVDGKRQVTALPNMTELGMAVAMSAVDEEDINFSFEKTGKTKKIHGYTCHEYIGKTDDEEIKGYIAQDFPVDMTSVFGEAGKQFMPKNLNEVIEEMSGFTMLSESKFENGKKSSFEVKKINDDGVVILTSDYQKMPLGN